MKKSLVLILATAALILAACQAPATPEPAILKVTSGGSQVAAFSGADINKMTAVEADYTGKDGAVTHYKGFALKDALVKPGITDASVITLVAADGYTAEISGKDLLECQGCMLVFQEGGGLRSVMPGLSSKLQVKDLIELQVK